MPPKKKASAPARATRSSVRAGTTALEDVPPPTPSTRRRQRSTSKASASSTVESDCKIIFDELKCGFVSPHRLTKAQLEAVIHMFIAQDEQRTTEITTLEDQNLDNTNTITELRGEISEMRTRLMDRPKVRDIRRHYSIEVPTQQRLQEDAEKAAAAAESALVTEATARRDSGARHAAERARSERRRQSQIAEDAESQSQMATEQTNGVSHREDDADNTKNETLKMATFTPSSWNLASFFSPSVISSAAKRVFSLSPTRRNHQARTSRVASNVPSPISERSPNEHRTPTPRVAESSENQDLSSIIRKRKTSDTDQQTLKRARTSDAKPSSTYNVPNDSDSDPEAEVNGQPHPQMTPTKAPRHQSNHTSNTSGEQESQSQDSQPSRHSTRKTKTPSRLLSQGPRTPSSQTSPSKSATTNGSGLPTTTPTRPGTEAPASHRRSAKQVREKREADAVARRKSQHRPSGHHLMTTISERIRPHYFEIQNVDSYKSQEALDAAVDAMLDIEEAEDQGLPAPHTDVSPAVRVFPRIRMDHFAPTSSAPGYRASVSKPKETNADKRSEQIQNAKDEKETERQRLLQKAKELREEQKKAEDELKRLEMEEEATQEVGKKRKRVKIDDLSEIPCRRPGQSSGTFALLDEFFDQDSDEEDYVEMDEDEIHLISSRPSKIARTEANIFNASASTQDVAEFEPEPQDATSPPQQSEALQRKRSEAEKYKPAKGSRLREVQRVSTGSSAAGTPKSNNIFSFGKESEASDADIQAPEDEADDVMPTTSGSTDLQTVPESPPTTTNQGFEQIAKTYRFPSSEALFSEEVLAKVLPLSAEQKRQGLIDFRKGLAAFLAGKETISSIFAQG